MFRRFAEYRDDKLRLPIECIVVIEMLKEHFADGTRLNLIIQNAMGQDIYKEQCKLKELMYIDKDAYVYIFFSRIWTIRH